MEKYIVDIAQKVKALSTEDRSKFFRSVCGDNDVLAAAIQEYLNGTDENPMTLTMADDASWLPDFAQEILGKKIGPYLIEKRLGEGGMGFVFLGSQEEPIRRKVAIKIIKPGLAPQMFSHRFMAERQALAILNHHNIAKIFDAGVTQEGLPFFAMEYINGKDIATYCNEHQLPIRNRIALFNQLCDAIQHANQNGILHRDLKPSNILVTENDGEAEVKVIDFGIAKALEAPLTDETFQTEWGRVVGTLQYMSPEQMNPDTGDIDTRSDVYTLGVLLQELLSGLRPFNLKELENRDFFAVHSHVLHGEPIKPSVRLNSQTDTLLEELAQERAISLKEFKKFLRGDLDWIILKAQAKSREDRYVTPYNLKADLNRFLANQPVLAGPPAVSYRLKKFAKRHRVAVSFSVLLLFALVSSLFGVTYGFVKERQAQIKSTATIDLLKEFLISPTPRQKGSELTVLELLESFEPKLLKIEDEDVRIDLLHTMARTHQSLGQTKKATEFYESGLEVLDENKKTDRIWVAKFKNGLHRIQAKYTPSEEVKSDIEAHWKQTLHWFGADHRVTQAASFNNAYIHQQLGFFEKAYTYCLDLLPRNISTFGKEHKSTLTTMMVMGFSLMVLERMEESIEIHEDLLKHAKKGHDALAIIAMGNLSNAYDSNCQFKDAFDLRQEAFILALEVYGERHPTTLWVREIVAYSFSALGYSQEALDLITQNYEINKENHGPDHYKTFESKSSQAIIYYGLEEYEKAFALESEAYEFFSKNFGLTHEQTMISYEILAILHVSIGNLEKALVMQRDVVQKREEVFGKDDPMTINSKIHLAGMIAIGDPEIGLAQFEAHYAKLKSTYSQFAALQDLLSILVSSNAEDTFGQYYERYFKILRACLDVEAPVVQDFLKRYQAYLTKKGDKEAAMALSAQL